MSLLLLGSQGLRLGWSGRDGPSFLIELMPSNVLDIRAAKKLSEASRTQQRH